MGIAPSIGGRTGAVGGAVVVAASNASPKWIAAADYVCDGVNDHAEIQAAIDFANNNGAAVDNGANCVGGLVQLSPGDFKDIQQIVMKSRVHLRGCGFNESRLLQKTNANVDFIINYVSTNAVEANAQLFELSDFTANGNRAAVYGAPGGNITGACVNFVQNPQFTKATNDIDYDPNYRMSDLWLLNAAQKGFTNTGRAHLLALRVYAYYCGTIGIVAGSDTYWTECASGQSGNQGFLVVSNSTLVNCVAFYAGWGNVAAFAGFEITATQGAYLSGCRAQDCGSGGFYLNGTTGTQIVGGQADSNSCFSLAGFANVVLFNAVNCSIQGITSSDRGAGNGGFGKQPFGLDIGGSSTGNQVTMQHVSMGGTVSAAIKGTAAANNQIAAGNVGGHQAPAYTAAYTPNPLLGSEICPSVLTGAFAVAVPAAGNSWPGQRITFTIVQDATGGRATTFAAGYKTNWSDTGNTLGKRQSVTFEYDGTNWNQVGACSGWI